MELPKFKYHPDPIGTGSIIKSDEECCCCGQIRGFIYIGPVYAPEEYVNCICPWCIADGSAHTHLEASFTDEDGIGGYGQWDKVSEEAIQEVAYRTPGFSGWQQEQWWTHCGDVAQFLGRAGRKELEGFGAEAIESIRAFADLDSEWDKIFVGLDKDGSPTSYVFRCVNCGKLGGYWDSD